MREILTDTDIKKIKPTHAGQCKNSRCIKIPAVVNSAQRQTRICVDIILLSCKLYQIYADEDSQSNRHVVKETDRQKKNGTDGSALSNSTSINV